MLRADVEVKGRVETAGSVIVAVTVDARRLDVPAAESSLLDTGNVIKLDSKDPGTGEGLVAGMETVAVLAELNKEELNLIAVVSV